MSQAEQNSERNRKKEKREEEREKFKKMRIEMNKEEKTRHKLFKVFWIIFLPLNPIIFGISAVLTAPFVSDMDSMSITLLFLGVATMICGIILCRKILKWYPKKTRVGVIVLETISLLLQILYGSLAIIWLLF